jgi:chromosome segregation ATPase
LFILEKIDKYVNELKKVDFTKKIANFEKESLSRNEKEIKIIHKKLEETYSDLSTLKGEVTKSLLGKSSFKPDLLNSLLEEKEVEVRKLNDKIRTIENEIKDKKNEVNDMKSLQAKIPVWKT